jgi:ribonuclease D
VQLITPHEAAVVDPQKVDVRPLWHAVSQARGVVVWHAGREEMNFLLRSVGKMPERVFDVQIAAGFASNEYPAAYSSVVGKFLGQQPLKGEQRTDWRRRC